MRTRRTLLPMLSGILLTSQVLVGCNNKPAEVTTAALPEQAETNAAVPSESYYTEAAKPLGTEQAAGPFTVVLTTEPNPPKVGDNSFNVIVTRDGKPVEGAEVNINLVDPNKSATGATFQLTPMGERYAAAQNLNTTETMHADVTVIANNERGHAVYVLNAVK